MSSNNDKKKQNKTESKSQKSKSTKSKEFINNQKIEPANQIEKSKSDTNTEENIGKDKENQETQDEKETEIKSARSISINPKDNIDKLLELKTNLNEGNKYFGKYINALVNLKDGNKDLVCCYQNEEYMNEYLKTKFLEKNRAFKLDDYLFEFHARKIFAEAFGLREKILYPFFSVEYSRNKRANTIKIYYYRLEIEERDKKINCFYFPIITDTFIVYYEEIPIIIEKKSSDDFLMSVMILTIPKIFIYLNKEIVFELLL